MNVKYAEAVTPGLLSCETETSLWMSWQGGHIVLGEGDRVGRRVILSYQDLDALPISALSVSTDGNTGLWRFPLAKRKIFEDGARLGAS